MNLFLMLVLIYLFEALFSVRLRAFYFRYGVPLYKKTIVVNRSPALDEESIAQIIKPTSLVPAFKFRSLSDHEVAFREKMVGFFLFSYTPVVHGLIKVDPSQNSITLTGLANWFSNMFVLCCVFVGIKLGDPEKYSFMILLPVSCYILFLCTQIKRYDNILKKLTDRFAVSQEERASQDSIKIPQKIIMENII